MKDPSQMRFAATHEWVWPQGETVRIGLSDHAQQVLTDVIHVDLPEPDDHHYAAREDLCIVESLSNSREIHAPVAGRIRSINSALLSNPELINQDPYGDGWVLEMAPDNMHDVEALMTYEEYEMHLPEDEENEDA